MSKKSLKIFKHINSTHGSTTTMRTITPRPGTYLVEGVDIDDGYYRKSGSPFLRLDCRVLEEMGKPDSPQVNREFSLFFNCEPTVNPQTGRSPLSYSASRLHLVSYGKWPSSDKMANQAIEEMAVDLAKGTRFVLIRTLEEGSDFPDDQLVNAEIYQRAVELGGGPEPDIKDIQAAVANR